MKIDGATLSNCCQNCFELAMDDRLTEEQQKQIGALGKILRGHLINLLTAKFKDGTQAVIQANEELSNLNSKINRVIKELDDIAGTIAAAASIAASLEKLISTAAMFV